MDSKTWNKGHARLRAKQRYGLDLTGREYDRLVKALIHPHKKYKGIEHESLGRISSRKSIHKIVYKNQSMIALYSTIQHNIQTFYPKEWDFMKMKMYAITHDNTPIDFSE